MASVTSGGEDGSSNDGDDGPKDGVSTGNCRLCGD
jgi:hypothetical protein